MTPALQQRLDEARARTKQLEARTDLDRPRRDIDWTDIGKSALTGARSGLESTVGGIGDIGALQKDVTLWLADKAGISARAASPHAVEHGLDDTGEREGLSPEAMELISSFTNPLSMAPTTEDVAAFTDKTFGRDDYTRHEATTPQGQNFQTASEFGSGLIGGPENLGKDLALKLGMASIPALKAGRKAMGLADDAVGQVAKKVPVEEVVAPHASGDPKNKYSKLVANKPLNEVTAGYENTAPLLPKKPFSPEQMEIGSNVLGIMGDRSVAGRRLMSVEGQPLTQGVDLRGGEGFTRGEAQQSYGAGWANEAGPAGALQNKINSNADRPTYLWYLPMSEQSIDASRHVSRPTLDLLAQAEPGRKAIEDFIPRLQKGIENEGGLDIAPSLGGRQKVADWLLGLKDWSETSSMKGRRALAQTMDTAKSRNSLGVDVGQVRLAATDPDLVNANTFEAGHSILRAEPGGSLIKDPALNHPDYGTQIPAEYQGRTETPVPYEDLFDDWARAREAKKPGERESERAYTFRLANPTQPVTQELIDRLMARQEMIRRIGESGGSR